MTISEKIFQIYQQFYDQRSVLQEAPPLTVNPAVVGMRDFPVEQAMTELNALVSYLLGRADVRKISFGDALNIVDSAYADQPFWRDLLLDYFDVVLSQREEAYIQKGRELQQQAENVIDEIVRFEAKRAAVVRFFADKIREAKFRVDASLLVYNYIKMMGHDAAKAKAEVVANPAYFAPIQVKDETGREVLTPAQAKEENKRLGQFLKKLFV